MTTDAINGTVHLVRHGRVENPQGVIYGRLPGFHLSEIGKQQATQAADHLAPRPVRAVWASPLERAQETAAAIAERHGVEVVTDERLIESATHLEGIGRTLLAFATSPRHWWRLRNPIRPSWGESYEDIRKRMTEVVAEALAAAAGGDAVVVSHQTPIIVARNHFTSRWGPPWRGPLRCETGSVTTLVLDKGRAAEGAYFAPSA
ncbi:MAG TPA: histidine phosphatase family protein [Actinomycetota bacterium]|jgi:broad specificity phosphatase PhoE|nr:histidine phosphatase family protein [Actinomycetota bacterium]